MGRRMTKIRLKYIKEYRSQGRDLPLFPAQGMPAGPAAR